MKASKLLLALAAAVMISAAALGADFEQRWVYSMPNFANDAEIDELISVIREAKTVGATHIQVKDPKFGFLGMQPPSYFANINRFRAAADEIGIEVVPALFPFGYSGGYLMHDPNLSAGLPVKDAPFVVTGGVAKPDPASGLRVANGGFEGTPGGLIAGWAVAENSAALISLDPDEKASGETSLRMSGFESVVEADDRQRPGRRGRGGNYSVSQHIQVQPFKYYRLTIKRKTAGLSASSSTVYIGSSDGSRRLCYTNFEFDPLQDWIDTVPADSDWREFQLSFNTLETRSIEIRVGINGASAGTIWWDDLQIEPAGLANVLRRPIKPFVVKSADRAVTYVEGQDFEPVVDPMLGNIPTEGAVFPRLPYDVWHEGPGIVLTSGSRIKEGDRLLVSFFHPHIIYGQQILVSMEDPKTYELMDDQMKRMVDAWGTRGYMMNHDEIRIAGWEEPWDGVKRTPGEILSYNISRSVEIARKYAPDAQLYTWSDMFDPFHNAGRRDGRTYYLCNGDYYGSWEGLPSDVAIFTWTDRRNSIAWFAERGHKQILCGYYDNPGLKANIQRWMSASEGAEGIVGMMYTTWTNNYSHMTEFFKLLAAYPDWSE